VKATVAAGSTRTRINNSLRHNNINSNRIRAIRISIDDESLTQSEFHNAPYIKLVIYKRATIIYPYILPFALKRGDFGMKYNQRNFTVNTS